MSQKLGSKDTIGIYDYDYQLNHVFALIKKDLSKKNYKLIKKYDMATVNSSLSKATGHKNLKMILSLSRLLNKDSEFSEMIFKHGNCISIYLDFLCKIL